MVRKLIFERHSQLMLWGGGRPRVFDEFRISVVFVNDDDDEIIPLMPLLFMAISRR